jgi:excisionase family DNA binding protein
VSRWSDARALLSIGHGCDKQTSGHARGGLNRQHGAAAAGDHFEIDFAHPVTPSPRFIHHPRMRYRITLARTQRAELHIRATDEEAALDKVRQKLAEPYGYFGMWDKGEIDIVDVVASPTEGVTASAPSGGPLLLSVKDAGEHLGISRATMYELVSTGEIESLQIGRRRLIPRASLEQFIAANVRAGGGSRI